MSFSTGTVYNYDSCRDCRGIRCNSCEIHIKCEGRVNFSQNLLKLS